MNLIEFCNRYWYKLKDKLPDNWDRYWTGIPSVTTILSLLEDWWLEYVLRNNKSSVTNSINEWIKTHEEAELFFKPNSWVVDLNNNIIKFHVLYNVKIIWTEVYYKKDICWTIDLVSDINWKIINCDYKNSKFHSTKYFLQLMGYKYLNWNDWLLVYVKWKLKVVEVDNSFYNIFIELKDYFFILKNGKGV
jgi:hypothetical protein